MYINDKKIDIIGIDKESGENGIMHYIIDNICKTAKVYYRPVTSWKQYMSNCYGLYFVARHNGHKKTVYLVNLPEYR